MAPRPMLILLKEENGNYRLDKVSYHVMPIEFTADDYKIYDPEDISIDSGVLHIQLYSYGPYGNVFNTFRFEDAAPDEIIIQAYQQSDSNW